MVQTIDREYLRKQGNTGASNVKGKDLEITYAEIKSSNNRKFSGEYFVMRRISPILAANLAENTYVYIRK